MTARKRSAAAADTRAQDSGDQGASGQTDAEALRFYGRRKGKPLKTGRKALIAELLPKIAIPVPATAIDPARLFPFAPDAVWLEIGFGSGEHLAAQAAAHPRVGLIGSEVYLNGVAALLQHVHAQNLMNVRVLHEDVRRLLPALPDASVARIFLLFPDPWPKARHAKRRFISPAMLDALARLLVDGGELRVASDHPVYIRWTLAHATQSAAFRWLVDGPADWRERPDDAIATRYEMKARTAGRAPAFLRFARQPRRLKPTT